MLYEIKVGTNNKDNEFQLKYIHNFSKDNVCTIISQDGKARQERGEKQEFICMMPEIIIRSI